MANYKCNDCGLKFQGEDYILECPSCNSNNITKQSVSGGSRFIEVLKNNRRLTIIIGVIITVIVLFSLKNCESDAADLASKELRIKTKNKDNYIEISLIHISKKKKEIVKFNESPQLYISAGFMAFQNGEQIKITEGKIYPCTSDFIKLTWNNGFGKILFSSKIINNFKIKTQVNKRAICREKLTLRVKPSECDCKLEVLSNYDEIDPSETIMISINGRNGEYSNKKEWTLNEKNNRYDVWGYIEGRDTIRAIPGNGIIRACVEFDADNYLAIAKKYADNPGDLNALSQFRSVTNKSFIIMYKGRKMTLNDLSNRLRTEWKNNGTKFKVNIKWRSTGNCSDVNKTVESINFN